MKFCLIFSLIFFSILGSCRTNIYPNNKKALDELVEKYPEMYGGGLIENYKIVRKLYNNVDSIEMQLLETVHGEEQIAILSNIEGQVYAIPFPDNDYRKYWSFYGDSAIKTKVSGNKTFCFEFNNALKKISIDKKSHAKEILGDLLISLLKFRPILDNDTTRIKSLASKNSPIDSCGSIMKNNYQAILRGMNPNESGWYYNTYWDLKHARAYQFDNLDPYYGMNKSSYIRIYRQPCISKRIYL